MAVPKQRTNSARRGRRRQNHKLILNGVSVSKKTGIFSVSKHRVDPETGKYRERDYSRFISGK